MSPTATIYLKSGRQFHVEADLDTLITTWGAYLEPKHGFNPSEIHSVRLNYGGTVTFRWSEVEALT